MIVLCRTMLDNSGINEEEEETSREESPEQLYRRILKVSAEESGDTSTQFLYSMIAPIVYGNALPGGRFTMHKIDSDLWLAGFAYESSDAFQSDDWLSLHEQCGRLPVFALYAADDFSLEKGGMSFLGGHSYEDWNHMAETWFWLRSEYAGGIPPEEAVIKLKKIEDIFARDDWDETIDELLQNCIDIITSIEPARPDHAESLRDSRDRRDYTAFEHILSDIAASYLWDADRSAKWLAVLKENLAAWQEWNS